MQLEDKVSLAVNQRKSTNQICFELNVSRSTVRRIIKRLGLSTNYPKLHQCSCGKNDASEFYSGDYSVCKSCTNLYRGNIARERRLYAINKLGGKCKSCGFNEYSCSLDIHHTDPDIKDENFDQLRSWTIERIDKEIESCVLLCKNCHSAFHSGHNIIY